ncbi:MAG: T9SS type A sorting domain-containing protein [Saprospiraceae bacterium]|nr:T9SS type A sorting domain-containing protein [Saprospiraceae bacterium]
MTQLESLYGLDSVSFISSLNIRNTARLRSLHGLEKVKNTFFLDIIGNQALETTEGLNLDRLPNQVVIQNNNSLRILTGVNNADSVTTLTITNNVKLQRIDIWDSLKIIRGNLLIDGNSGLKEINGLNRLKRVNGSFSIENVDSIEYLPNFDSLEFIGKFLRLTGFRDSNGNFRNFNTKNLPLFGNLKIVNNNILIQGFISAEMPHWNGFENLIEVNDIYIYNSRILNLSGFNAVSRINTLALVHLSDTDNISGFSKLTELGSLSIDRSYELRNVTGFRVLRRVNGKVYLYASNVYLESFEGLANLEYVGGDLECISNRRLRNIGTKNLKYVGGQLYISDADQMKSLDDLSNLEYIGKEVYISLNDSLADVRGLDRVDYKNVTKLTFRYNNFTKSCVNNFFCDFLENKPEEMSDIRNNGAGCSSREEVLEQCRLVSTTDIGEESVLTLSPNPAASEIYLRNIGPQQIQAIVLYDLSGRQVLYQKTEGDRIDVSRLAAGVYKALIILPGQEFSVRRIVKL